MGLGELAADMGGEGPARPYRDGMGAGVVADRGNGRVPIAGLSWTDATGDVRRLGRFAPERPSAFNCFFSSLSRSFSALLFGLYR